MGTGRLEYTMSFSLLLLVAGCTCTKAVRVSLATLNRSCSIKADDHDISRCPSWFQPSKENGTCECGKSIPQVAQCDDRNNQSQVSLFMCVTYSEKHMSVFSGGCPYNQLSANKLSLESFVFLPQNLTDLNEAMCGGLNRTGLLCSECRDGLGPSVLTYSRECVECLGVLHGVLSYVTLVVLLSTIFCVVMILVRFDITQASMNAFILYSQLFSSFVYVFPSVFSNPSVLTVFALSFYGLWNLDFFRAVLPPFCISPSMNTLQVISLDYIVALYPLFFTAVLYYCVDLHDRGCRVLVTTWKPFHSFFVRFRSVWNLKGTVINVFASLLLLSYSKLLSLSCVLLLPVTLRDGCGNYLGLTTFFDSSVGYFKAKHLPCALFATVALITGVLFPLLFILCFPCKFFQKFLCSNKLRITLLCELAKVRHKSFKDGSNGTRDFRSFAAFYLIIRVCIFICTLFKYGSVLAIFVTGFSSILVAILRPYKNYLFNVLDSLFLFASSFFVAYGLVIYSGVYPDLPFTPLSVFSITPFVYFVFLFILKVLQVTKVLDYCKTVIHRGKTEEERLPHRLLHSSEYTPLLTPVQQPTNHTVTIPTEKQ